MLSYRIDPAVLRPWVPAGTELDFYQGQTFVSIVGFLFLNTRVLGVPIPFHQNFAEVNLRFYVRRLSSEGWRRGVVFIRELVPRLAIALIARSVYNENYSAVTMTHRLPAADSANNRRASYGWLWQRTNHEVSVRVQGAPREIIPGSDHEFITEHYWGYTTQRDGSTMEYHVDHPRWRIWPAVEADLTGPLDGCYGADFARYLRTPPTSAFLAEGSLVKVYQGVRL
jgi:uncharacterized protein YqjF (DUF2071 family)